MRAAGTTPFAPAQALSYNYSGKLERERLNLPRPG